MKTYVVLVEWQLPDDTGFDIAARPLIDAIRELSPCPPTSITAHVGEQAKQLAETRASFAPRHHD